MANTIYYPNGNTSSTGGSPASNNTSTSFLNLLTNMLQTGLTISNGDGSYCCPTCEEGTQKVYFLASIPKAIQILNNLGYKTGDTLNCCLNISSVTSTPAYQYFNSLFTYQCCPNNFSSCVNELTSKLGASCCNDLQQLGIVEYGTLELTEESPFCSILNNLLKVTPALTHSELCAIYKEILETGFIIKCDGCNMTIEKAPDFPPCFCYKVTVPEGPSTTYSVSVSCEGIPVTYSNLTLGEYYYCSSIDPVVSPGITFEKLSDCALVPCTTPPPPCTCYEFVIQAPQAEPIPVTLSCQGQITVEYLNQGIHRFCSDSYPIVSPEVTINVLTDCESEPCVSPPPPNCGCYTVYNPNEEVCSFEYVDCNTNTILFQNIEADHTSYVCALAGSVVGTCPGEGALIINQIANDCLTCTPPPPLPCVCYEIHLTDPNFEGTAPTCSFEYTDCEGNLASTSIFVTGYICSQTIPVAICRGITVSITQVLLGDCNNPLVGCPPVLPPI